MLHKAGFVSIIGKPNVGKSTLMNALVGEKLSIITFKAQTTRHRIMGIVSGEDFQIIYSDTPGILKPHYKLHHTMMSYVNSALEDADLILYVLDATDEESDPETLNRLKSLDLPIICVINKTDLVDEEKIMGVTSHIKDQIPGAHIVAASALRGNNLDSIFDTIISLLPQSPPYYDKDTLTDRTQRFFVSEIIREKIFLNYKQEIPYSSEVIIEDFKESDELIKITAYIFVDRETQKGIVLGHKGAAIKKVGMEARKEIEEWLGTKVFLGLSVKVKKDWRNDEAWLNKLGYGMQE